MFGEIWWKLKLTEPSGSRRHDNSDVFLKVSDGGQFPHKTVFLSATCRSNRVVSGVDCYDQQSFRITLEEKACSKVESLFKCSYWTSPLTDSE
ncbi:hypothetical protein DM82_2812 [Burkholderia oklahomensis]|uniref:Uncharacterized protein n=2 Tax=Burkholderia oklahomensis TaxID=342113 RepID=A0AAI8B3Z3_9BURK|nr:hypothetical protein DM82_2812 [Burkholderia oklahomensis]AOI41098.1 hypothetical protein WG70_15285 [Burkholderia oklahomensis EO147]KUY64759.1 hypothetical protein WG70_28945 [Burkholderia oklahomensis EO147]